MRSAAAPITMATMATTAQVRAQRVATLGSDTGKTGLAL
jgi:hypothetical protein